MNTPDPLIKIRFDGKAVGPGRISVAHLLRFLSNFNKVLLRSGMVLAGQADSLRRGAPDKSAKEAVALDLVLLTHGSPAAVLGLERKTTGADMLGYDFGAEIFETTMRCLDDIQQEGDIPPAGCDAGVLLAWRDVGVLFSQGVESIEFTLNHRASPFVTKFTPLGFANIQRRIQGPVTNIRTIEGRLLMADFKEHGTRCRIHPSTGDPVLCLFDEAQKDEVLEDILQYVRIVGEAKEDPVTGRIASIRIHDIERLEDKEDESLELLPQGSPLPRNFWYSPTFDELAAQQNVHPMANIEALFGTWPGEVDDGFELVIDELRHHAVVED